MASQHCMKKEDYEKISELDSRIEQDPSNAELWLKKGQIFYSKMADNFAIEAFRKAIELNPHYVDAYFGLAECLYFHVAEWEEAEKVALSGLQIDPNRKDLIDLLKSIRESLARWAKTVEKIHGKKI